MLDVKNILTSCLCTGQSDVPFFVFILPSVRFFKEGDFVDTVFFLAITDIDAPEQVCEPAVEVVPQYSGNAKILLQFAFFKHNCTAFFVVAIDTR